MEERAKIKKILHRATALLCQHLCMKSSSIIPNLKSEGALTDGDVEEIESHPRKEDKIDAMLVLLKRKPAKAYYSFMDVLWKNEECEDLFHAMERIEKEFGFSGRYIFLMFILI